MEYHFGYKNLKLKLESAGFTVTTTKPCHVFGQTPYFGYLFATRKDLPSASWLCVQSLVLHSKQQSNIFSNLVL